MKGLYRFAVVAVLFAAFSFMQSEPLSAESEKALKEVSSRRLIGQELLFIRSNNFSRNTVNWTKNLERKF
jgi:hypothetical protein